MVSKQQLVHLDGLMYQIYRDHMLVVRSTTGLTMGLGTYQCRKHRRP